MDFNQIKKEFADKNAWGLHTLYDAKGCNDFIRNRDKIQNFTITLCDIIDMKRYGECMTPYFGDDEKVKGYSLAQFVETSLVSAHFAESMGNAYIDVFSCNCYDPYAVRDFIKMFFKPGQIEMRCFYRQ